MRQLLAYDAAGGVVATLDYLVAKDEAGHAIGLLDFGAHEDAGGQLTDIWSVSNAIGSGTWPEFLGARAHDFNVELVGKRISALVHRSSGARRERAALEAAIAAVPTDEHGLRDITPIVGSPTRPVAVDDQGRDAPRHTGGSPAHLPIIGGRRR